MKDESIRKTILRRMFSARKIGSNHIRIDTLKHCGFPRHLMGEIEKEIKELIKEGIICYQKKGKEAVSLNPERIGQIQEEIA